MTWDLDGGTMTIAGWTPERAPRSGRRPTRERVGAGAIASGPCGSRRSTTSTGTCRRSRRCSRKSSARASTRSCAAGTSAPARCPGSASRGARGRRVRPRQRGPRAQPQWLVAELGEQQGRFLAGLPSRRRSTWTASGRRASATRPPARRGDRHPRDPRRRARGRARGVDERVVVAGHVHVQVDRVVAGRRYVNAGSVGMPYEGRRGAFWALLGPDVELRRTTYDVEDAVRRIRATAYPDAEEQVGAGSSSRRTRTRCPPTSNRSAKLRGSVRRVRVAALYDVHGNLPALEAVLEEVQARGRGRNRLRRRRRLGPQPGEGLHRVEEAATHFVRGNADRHVAGGNEAGTGHLVPGAAHARRADAPRRLARERRTRRRRDRPRPLLPCGAERRRGRADGGHARGRRGADARRRRGGPRRLRSHTSPVRPDDRGRAHRQRRERRTAVRGPPRRVLGAARAGSRAAVHRLRRRRGAADPARLGVPDGGPALRRLPGRADPEGRRIAWYESQRA